jgi:hypothetical protein
MKKKEFLNPASRDLFTDRSHAHDSGSHHHASMEVCIEVNQAVGGAEAAAPKAAALAVGEALGPADVGAVGAAYAGSPEAVALGLARPRLRPHHRTSHLLCNRRSCRKFRTECHTRHCSLLEKTVVYVPVAASSSTRRRSTVLLLTSVNHKSSR